MVGDLLQKPYTIKFYKKTKNFLADEAEIVKNTGSPRVKLK